jgi:hypothetical protein
LGSSRDSASSFSIDCPRSSGVVGVVVLGGAILLEALQFAVPDRNPRAIVAFERFVSGEF